MDNKTTFFIQTEDGDFVVVNEYGEPILDENGKHIEYIGSDRFIAMNKIYINTNRAHNYTLDYGDKQYRRDSRNGNKKNHKHFKKPYYKK